MDEFQGEVLQRLTKIETKLDNGLVHEMRELKEWTQAWMSVHPQKCPLVERKKTYVVPVVVAVLTAVTLKVIDLVVKVVT